MSSTLEPTSIGAAYVLAGGRGTRLHPVTGDRIPKVLVPLAGKPVLEWSLEGLARHGCRRAIVAVGHLAEAIEAFVEDLRRRRPELAGLEVQVRRELVPLGTAGALPELAAEGGLGESFFVIYGDVFMDLDFAEIWRGHLADGAAATVVVHPNDHPQDSDLILHDRDRRITRLLFKPHPSGVEPINCVNAGLYILSRRMVEHVPRARASDFVRDVFAAALAAGERLMVRYSSEYLKDMGTPRRLEEVERDLRSGRVAARSRRQPRRAIFLDRDGTLNVEKGLIHRAEDLELEPGAAEAVRRINHSPYLCGLITNQSVVARGLLSLEELEALHRRLGSLLARERACLDFIYYCPHHPDAGFEGEVRELKFACGCRKPEPGLLRAAEAAERLDLARSFFVGDSLCDVQAGRAAGVSTALILRTPGSWLRPRHLADLACGSLLEAVELILERLPPLEPRLETAVEELAASRRGSGPALVLVEGSAAQARNLAGLLCRQARLAGLEAGKLALEDWLEQIPFEPGRRLPRLRLRRRALGRAIHALLGGQAARLELWDPLDRRPSGVILDEPPPRDLLIVHGERLLALEPLRRLAAQEWRAEALLEGERDAARSLARGAAATVEAISSGP